MKKLMKQVLTLLLALSVIFMFAGCAANNPTSSKDTDAKKVESDTDAKKVETDTALDARTTVKIIEDSSADPIKIAVLGFQSNPYWFPIRDGVDYAKTLLENKNCTVDWIVVGETMDAAKMSNAIDTCIVDEYDGIITCAFEDSIAAAIDRAVDAGITVYTMDSDPSVENGRSSFFGQDYKLSGELAAEYIANSCGGKGKVGIITGMFGASCPEARTAGFKEYMSANYPDIEVIGVWENKDNAETAYDLTKNMLTADEDLAGIYVNAGGPFGAAQALEELDMCDQVTLVCHDFIEENYSHIYDGGVDCIVGEDPFQIGFDPVASMYNYLVGGIDPGEFYYTTMVNMTSDNVDEIANNL